MTIEQLTVIKRKWAIKSEIRRANIVIALRKEGFTAYDDGEHLVTDASRMAIGLVAGNTLVTD